MTFSIVAVDREAQEIGMAIASCNWDARGVCMARAESGAIASQGSGDQALLPQYFEHLEKVGVPEALVAGLETTFPQIAGRQSGAGSFTGKAAAYTG